MKTRTRSIGAGLVLALAALVTPVSATQKDCDVERPQAETPDSTTDAAPDTATKDTLTEKLATCGSVLNPPPLGDTDIVEPAPFVDDDINIHPDAPAIRP